MRNRSANFVLGDGGGPRNIILNRVLYMMIICYLKNPEYIDLTLEKWLGVYCIAM